MASVRLRDAVLTLSADTPKAVAVLRHVGALERATFLDTLRPLNIGRWAAVVHRLADDPNMTGEFSSEDIRHARNLCRQMVGAVAA